MKLSSAYGIPITLTIIVIVGLIIYLAIYFSNKSSSSGSGNPIIPPLKTINGKTLSIVPGTTALVTSIPNKLATLWLNMTPVLGSSFNVLLGPPKTNLIITATMLTSLGSNPVELYNGTDYITNIIMSYISLPDKAKTDMAIRLNNLALILAPNPTDTYSVSFTVAYQPVLPPPSNGLGSIITLPVHVNYTYTYF